MIPLWKALIDFPSMNDILWDLAKFALTWSETVKRVMDRHKDRQI